MSNLVLLLLALSIRGCYSIEEIQHWMYQSIDGFAVNFRNLNGTNEFGSSSSLSGAYGVIHVIHSKEDAVALIDNGIAGPYVAVLVNDTFNESVMNLLTESDKISGVIVGISSKAPASFSFDSKCPNSDSGDLECDVNPFGNSFLLRSWPFPVVLMESASSKETIIKCFTDFNLPFDNTQLNRRLCSLHIKNHMFAATNSEVCIRRNGYSIVNPMKYCDPLGGQNIILPLGNFWSGRSKETLIVSARLDVASMFDGVAPGAMSSVTGIVTLLTAAHIFKTLLPDNYSGDRSVLFILFNGEAYDYIGSSRIVYDIQKGQFPYQGTVLHSDQISMFIDINQLSYLPLFFHVKNKDNEVAKLFVEEMIYFSLKHNLNWTNTSFDNNMPTSFHSFMKLSEKLPGLTISNYKNKFSNRYYHGLYDLADNIKYVFKNGSDIDLNSVQFYLGKVAEGIALSLLKYMTGTAHSYDTLNSNFSAHLVDELLNCYIESNHCKYMKAVITKDIKIKEEPESLYVGVGRGSDVITKLTGRILAYLTSPNVTADADNCTNNDTLKPYSYIWMNGLSGTGVCINSTLKFTPAVSPAFDIEGYNWTSNEYSTWTESAWQDLDVYLFLKPPPSQELVTFITGLVVLAISFVVVYWFNKDYLRQSTDENSPCF